MVDLLDKVAQVMNDFEYFIRRYIWFESLEEIEVRCLQSTISRAIAIGNNPKYDRSKIDKSFNDCMKRLNELYNSSFTQHEMQEVKQ